MAQLEQVLLLVAKLSEFDTLLFSEVDSKPAKQSQPLNYEANQNTKMINITVNLTTFQNINQVPCS